MEETAPHSLVVPILAIGAFVVGRFWPVGSSTAERAKDPSHPALQEQILLRRILRRPHRRHAGSARHAAAFFDKWIIDGLFVRGLSGGAWGAGFVLRFLQFGNLQGYAFLFGLGVVATFTFWSFANDDRDHETSIQSAAHPLACQTYSSR